MQTITPSSVGEKTKPLKVLFVSHAYVVGVNQGKLDAIAAKDSVEVALLAPKRWQANEWNKSLPLENPFPRIKLFPASILFSGRGGACLYSPLAIWQAMRHFQPDILQVEHEVFSLAAFQFALLARLTHKPIFFFGWENMERSLSPFRRWLRRIILKTAAGVICGNSDGAQLVKAWGFQGDITVMPQMGVDPQVFPPKPESAQDKVFTIGFVGRLAHQKGIDTLITAAQLLQQQGHRFRLVICGSGPDEASLKQAAHIQTVNELITWRGGVRHDEVPQEMQAFDALVLPSRTVDTWKEQFGHVLIEAMATNVPVVGSSCGEIPNVIGRSDLVFTEANPQELAAILARLISDADWRSHVTQYCFDRVQAQYTHQSIAERLITLWRNALS